MFRKLCLRKRFSFLRVVVLFVLVVSGACTKLPEDPVLLQEMGMSAKGCGDKQKAFGLFDIACKMGNSDSCYEVAKAHLLGDGIAKDGQMAAKLLEPLCEVGQASACSDLATMLEEGRDIPGDAEKVISFLFKACKLRSADECERLGRILSKWDNLLLKSEGLSVLQIACDNGSKTACTKLEELNKGRPPHMPCLIVAEHSTTRRTECVLKYDDAGRMTKAFSQKAIWGSTKWVKYGNSEETSFLYHGDGRLRRVIRDLEEGRQSHLKLNYDFNGRLSTYEFEEGLANGYKNKHAGAVSYDSDGTVLSLIERGRVFMGGMQNSTENHQVRFRQEKGLYEDSILVWPFDMDTPYLGWARDDVEATITGRYGGHLNVWFEFTFKPDGRIASWKSDNGITMNFIYDCPAD